MRFAGSLGVVLVLSVSAHTAVHAAAHVADSRAPLECVSCHRQAQSQHSTGMANALQSGTVSPILATHAKLSFRQGPYSYTIERQGERSIYRVNSGSEEFSSPILWSFGLGAAGQTYLITRDGHWYEGRVSYYKDIDALDLTVGARPEVPSNLSEAVGRELSKRGAEECFHCHSTGALSSGVLNTDKLTPGIQCARCHEKTDEHLAGFASKQTVFPPKLGRMSSEETADFCGQCHRTWATIALQGPHNSTNVRFQPYRLVSSRCYDAADSRIRCTSCHDPHSDAPRTIASYDKQCQSCHSASNTGQTRGKPGSKLCKVAKSECVSCHMPKVEIKDAHNKFTDHWIRIVRPGSAVPY